MGRDVLSETRYVELVLVTDQNLYQNMDSNRGAVVRRMIDIANTVDLYYRQFNFRIALIGVEVWTTNQISIDKKATSTMARFLKWRTNTLLPRLQNDNAHLLVGDGFEYGVTGLAPLSVMCSSDYSGGVNIDVRPSHLAVSSTLAHEMGHNLGMTHDTPAQKCSCKDNIIGGCIMDRALRDVKCGKIQCKGGEDIPPLLDNTHVKTVEVTVMGTTYHCKAAHVSMPDFRISERLRVGVKCARGKILYLGTCT
ncbi:disintegrin and metalloproteinase domain-containing protein 12-like [Chiloscyllium plagiosum]|uniref:disintegrin and metalloproteinase domain-containing protein 12-like n=1 Tax=Chiloscyllium plagiosum TaxID=36176 RepID=UPI001CB7D827|nr:disintegrin and metalloproteinase domain-containing protein 12-like [Chiloscyllium plagiosum]